MAAKKKTPPKTNSKKDKTSAGKSNIRWYLMLTLKIILALAVVMLFIYVYWSNQNEEARMHAKIEQLKKEIGAQAASLSDSHDELAELAAELEETEFELRESEEESVQLEKDIENKMKEMLSLQKQKETQREQMRQANSAKMQAKQKEIEELIAVYQSNIDALSAGSPEELKKIADEKKASIDKIKETNADEIAEMEKAYSKLAIVVDEDIATRKTLMKEELDKDLEKYDKQIEKLQVELEPLSEADGEAAVEKIKLLNGEITVIGEKRAAAQGEYVAELLSVEEGKKKELVEMQKDKRAAINARKAAHAQFISKEEASYKAMIRNDEAERTAMVNEHKKQIEQLTFEKDSEIQDLDEKNNSLESDLSKVTSDLADMKKQKETINTRNADLQKAIEVHKKRDEEIKKLTSVYQCKSNTPTDLANCTAKVKASIDSKKSEREKLISTITKTHADGVAALKLHKGWKTNSVYTPCPNGADLIGGGPGDTYACKFRSFTARDRGAGCVPGYKIPISEKLVLPPGKMKQFFPNLPSCNFQTGNVWYVPINVFRTHDEHIVQAKKYNMSLATFNTREEWNMFISFERAYRPKYYGQKGGYHVGMQSVTKDGVFKGQPKSSESWKYYDNSVFFKDVAPGDTVPPFQFIVQVYEHPLGLKPLNPTVGYNVGKYNIPNHLNDKVSFILVHAGYAVTIFEHHNQTGRSEKFTGSKNLLESSFRGKVSSILIERTSNGRPEMFQLINSKKMLLVLLEQLH
ncbi:putative membrane protein [Emiliania huxleyi virus 156]|nr:putative membrane protein [Emiliania huxleyi virus 156]